MIASPAIVIDKIDKEEAQEVTESWKENGQLPYDSVKNANDNNRFQQRQGSTRRLIKVDYSVIQNTDDDDDEEEEEEYTEPKANSNIDELAKVTQQNAMCRTGTVSSANTNSSSGINLQSYEKNLERRPISTPVSSTLQSMKSASCTIF